MPILAAYVLFLASQLAVPQDSSLLRSLYGEPEFQRFAIRPDIGLTIKVERAPDGVVCNIRIKPRERLFVEDKLPEPSPSPVSPEQMRSLLHPKLMSRKTADEVLEEVMGPGVRGWAPAMHTQTSCLAFESGSYNKASIALVVDACAGPDDVRGIEIGIASPYFSAEQKAVELRSRYGPPDAERFLARPGIRLDVEYGSDGGACEMRIEPGKTPLSFELAKEILDEAVPPNTRGALVNGPGSFQATCAMSETREYDNVKLWLSGNGCSEQVQHAGATFKRAVCQNLPQ